MKKLFTIALLSLSASMISYSALAGTAAEPRRGVCICRWEAQQCGPVRNPPVSQNVFVGAVTREKCQEIQDSYPPTHRDGIEFRVQCTFDRTNLPLAIGEATNISSDCTSTPQI